MITLNKKKFNKNTTYHLKKQSNNLITANYAKISSIKLHKIGDDYHAVKTHKRGLPLRQIISYIFTTGSQFSKTIDKSI